MALGGALGPDLSPVTPRPFAWQAWHLVTSTLISRGRRGTIAHPRSFCVAGASLMALGGALGPGLGGRDARDAEPLLRGRRGTWWHPPWFHVAGVSQSHIHGSFAWQAWHQPVDLYSPQKKSWWFFTGSHQASAQVVLVIPCIFLVLSEVKMGNFPEIGGKIWGKVMVYRLPVKMVTWNDLRTVQRTFRNRNSMTCLDVARIIDKNGSTWPHFSGISPMTWSWTRVTRGHPGGTPLWRKMGPLVTGGSLLGSRLISLTDFPFRYLTIRRYQVSQLAKRSSYPSDSVTAGLAQTLLSTPCQSPKWVKNDGHIRFFIRSSPKTSSKKWWTLS